MCTTIPLPHRCDYVKQLFEMNCKQYSIDEMYDMI